MMASPSGIVAGYSIGGALPLDEYLMLLKVMYRGVFFGLNLRGQLRMRFSVSFTVVSVLGGVEHVLILLSFGVVASLRYVYL